MLSARIQRVEIAGIRLSLSLHIILRIMTLRLDHCFRHSGSPCSDPDVHAAFVEVEMWRMLEEARRADSELNSIRTLEEWTIRQQGELARVPDSDERDYRLSVLKIATNRVRSRLRNGLV